MRSPDPMAACRPGGSCRECNPPPVYCARCTNVAVENSGDLCDPCAAAHDCAWCGEETHGPTYCSSECARADQSGDA